MRTDPLASAEIMKNVGSEAVTGEFADEVQSEPQRPYLPIFGVPQAKNPDRPVPAPTATEPEFGYELRGIIASGSMRWAILSDGRRDLLVREGDRVTDHARIRRIHPEGVDVVIGPRQLSVTFSESDPIALFSLTDPRDSSAGAHVTGSTTTQKEPHLQMVGSRRMSREDVLQILDQANLGKAAREWLPETR